MSAEIRRLDDKRTWALDLRERIVALETKLAVASARRAGPRQDMEHTAVARRRKAARRSRRDWRAAWPAWVRTGIEIGAVVAAALLAVVAVLGRVADRMVAAGPWTRLVAVAALVLGLGIATAAALRAWLALRRPLAASAAALPAALGLGIAAGAIWAAVQPGFRHDLARLRFWLGGSAEAQRTTLAHQVYAAYRRAAPTDLRVVLERARLYEPTVLEAAAAFGVDGEVLMGIGSAESAFDPRDSRDGGRGLFQITAPPDAAVAAARARLGADRLDLQNQRHNAFVAAATFRHYLEQMRGDLVLALVAYNIGPRNGGLRAIVEQYGARDFVTIQPYLQTAPRDYPIRVLAAALAYRLWRREGNLPRYEEGANALRIQSVGIPGLDGAVS